MKATTNLQDFAQMNWNANAYGFKLDMSKYPSITVDLNAQIPSVVRQVETDLQLLILRGQALDKRQGIRVGDYINHKNGTTTRVTMLHDEKLQAGGGSGSYYISKDGCLSYSGGLDSPIPTNTLQETTEKKAGLVWFFSDNWAGASRGVYGYIDFKVFNEI